MSDIKKAVISVKANTSQDLPLWVRNVLQDKALPNKALPKFLSDVANVVVTFAKGVLTITFDAAARAIYPIFGKIKDNLPTSLIRNQNCSITIL